MDTVPGQANQSLTSITKCTHHTFGVKDIISTKDFVRNGARAYDPTSSPYKSDYQSDNALSVNYTCVCVCGGGGGCLCLQKVCWYD